MRTNIVIDDALMQQAMELSGLTTKKEAVEEGLKLLVRLSAQGSIKELFGNVPWDGDLDVMRTD